MPDLIYNENEQEHKNFADTLGGLQGRVVKGIVTRSTEHAYYIGLEIEAKFPGSKTGGEYFLKCDATGSGSGNSQRSKNRVVVKVDSSGKLIENTGWIWRHDNRVEKMGAGFFARAKVFRAFV